METNLGWMGAQGTQIKEEAAVGYVRDCLLERRDLPAELTVNRRWGNRWKRNFKLSKKQSC